MHRRLLCLLQVDESVLGKEGTDRKLPKKKLGKAAAAAGSTTEGRQEDGQGGSGMQAVKVGEGWMRPGGFVLGLRFQERGHDLKIKMQHSPG
jgi:hypothetical protein